MKVVRTDIGRVVAIGRDGDAKEGRRTRRGPPSSRRKVFETFSLNLCSRDACFCGGTGNRDAGRAWNEGPRRGGSVAGNCDEIWWPLLIKIV